LLMTWHGFQVAPLWLFIFGSEHVSEHGNEKLRVRFLGVDGCVFMIISFFWRCFL